MYNPSVRFPRRQPSRHSPVGSGGQGLCVECLSWTDMGHGSPARHSCETTRWAGRLPKMGLSVSTSRWEPLGSPQGVARCRNQIRKNSNVVPRGHPHRCRSRLDQALTGPNIADNHTSSASWKNQQHRIEKQQEKATVLRLVSNTGIT